MLKVDIAPIDDVGLLNKPTPNCYATLVLQQVRFDGVLEPDTLFFDYQS